MYPRLGPKPYKFIGFGDIHGLKPFKFMGFGDICGVWGARALGVTGALRDPGTPETHVYPGLGYTH